MIIYDAEQLQKAFITSFVDRRHSSEEQLRSKLILNGVDDNNAAYNVLGVLLKEYRACERFDFSVAFITSDGLDSFLADFASLPKPGRILTGDYLDFTDPDALEKILRNFPAIQLRALNSSKMAFHEKGYTFYRGGYAVSIIGSANMTSNALRRNKELNVRLVSTDNSLLYQQLQNEFEDLWDSADVVDSPWLEAYRRRSQEAKAQRERIFSRLASQTGKAFKPNVMQVTALQRLEESRQEGKKRALLISATGTGKTFLSAFDVRAFKPRRMLYIAHREQILDASMQSFQTVMPDVQMSKFGGSDGRRGKDAPFLFAMVKTMTDSLESFSRDEFDYLIVDEAHRSQANSYKKVLDYFNPRFVLGMTATPERTDGQEIYSLFGNNVAYEIRLKGAMEAGLLCEFIYYGIDELSIDGEAIDDKTEFNHLVLPQRVEHIINKLDCYGYSRDEVHGLIFCSRNEEAAALSEELNKAGLRTLALSGSDDFETREKAFRKLEKTELQYLISVDILNEGVDLPYVNQIVLLRPTQSAIVFTQQLGRGLRLFPGKLRLKVIDFIGAYANNYMIPMVLYDDRSYDKDNMRRVLVENPVTSVAEVHFEQVAKERIFKSIDSARTNSMQLLKDNYLDQKARLGRVPMMMDFETSGSFSPRLFLKPSQSYYDFAQKMEGKDLPCLGLKERQSLLFFSQILTPGLRLEEIGIVSLLLRCETVSLASLRAEVRGFAFSRGCEDMPMPSEIGFNSAVSILSNGFFPDASRKKYGNQVYLVAAKIDSYEASPSFKLMIKNAVYRAFLKDSLETGLFEYFTLVSAKKPLLQEDGFFLYRKYTREDACRMLGWAKDEQSTIYGYKVDRATNTTPIFVTYHKDSEVSQSIDYNDEFVNERIFSWDSRNKRTLESEEIKAILQHKKSGMRILLFIKKSDDEPGFYYVGNVSLIPGSAKEKVQPDTKLSVVNMQFLLQNEVPQGLYNYLTGFIPESKEVLA